MIWLAVLSPLFMLSSAMYFQCVLLMTYKSLLCFSLPATIDIRVRHEWLSMTVVIPLLLSVFLDNTF